MSGRRSPDLLTADLFDVPQPTPLSVSHDLDVPLREALNAALKACPQDRHHVAAEMSRLTGRNVTRYMLDSYTADSRDDHNFPFRYAAAFEVATGSHALTQLLAQNRGCKVLVGEESLLAELGRIEQAEANLKRRKDALKRYLGKREK